jgi:5-methylcytosine-specific restriction endonuclease McrA
MRGFFIAYCLRYNHGMRYKADYKRLYDTQRWKRLRKEHLMKNPLCADCLRFGIITQAAIVDHINPHKGNDSFTDSNGFYNPANLQSLCKPCHDKHKHILELHGYNIGSDTQGNPLHSFSHWNR